MLDTIVKLSVVVYLVLFRDLADSRCELNDTSVLKLVTHLLKKLLSRLNITLSRVEGCQDNRFCLRVLQDTVLVCVECCIHEGITFILKPTICAIVITVIARFVHKDVFGADVVFLRLSEQLDVVLSVGHPWVRHDLLCRQSLLRVLLQKTSEHVASLLRDDILKLVLCLDDHFLQLGHMLSSEWHDTIQHSVEYYTT